MTKIICFLNQKGGVGKTTISFNLAYYISSLLGKKTLIIDTDPQASIYFIFNKRKEQAEKNNDFSFQTLFVKQLQDLHDDNFKKYDYVIVDTQGAASADVVTVLNKLQAHFIIPVLPSFVDIKATEDVIAFLNKQEIKFKLLINGLHHSASPADFQNSLRSAGIDCFYSYLTHRNIYKTATGLGRSVLEEDPNFKEFKAFGSEVISWINGAK